MNARARTGLRTVCADDQREGAQAMSDDEDMTLRNWPAMRWEISKDRRTAKAFLPPIRLAAVAEPINIHFVLDARAMDDLLQRASEVRARMLPAPRRN